MKRKWKLAKSITLFPCVSYNIFFKYVCLLVNYTTIWLHYWFLNFLLTSCFRFLLLYSINHLNWIIYASKQLTFVDLQNRYKEYCSTVYLKNEETIVSIYWDQISRFMTNQYKYCTHHLMIIIFYLIFEKIKGIKNHGHTTNVHAFYAYTYSQLTWKNSQQPSIMYLLTSFCIFQT